MIHIIYNIMSNNKFNLILFYIAYNLITCSRDKIRSRNLDSHQPNLQKNVIKNNQSVFDHFIIIPNEYDLSLVTNQIYL